LVSSLLVYKNMWQYKEIEQYQLIQVDKNLYKLRISIKEKFTKRDKIIGEYKEYLGKDAIITLEIVDEIPLLDSGKRRKVVQEYYK
jgi:phenylacetate-CoA ligase